MMGRSDFDRNLKAMRNYNLRRIQRAMEIDPQAGNIAFRLIPYMLHVQAIGLAGFIPKEEPPTGILQYNKEPGVAEELAQVFHGFNAGNEESEKPPHLRNIHSLFLMGSIGTVAQTKSSDFDYWVVVNEKELGRDGIKSLRRKLTAIEEWAETKRMEVHFFICDMEKTRKNIFGTTDKESSGSSQGSILKEEFYRTCILIAGKDPMWWAFPPGLADDEYADFKEDLLLEGYLDENDLVDLGNASPLQQGELFGALLWQFNKAMQSPYKSALKMALLEALIGTGGSQLCDRLKTKVIDDTEKSAIQDPYVIMFEFVRSYYIKKGQAKAARLLEKCFILKTTSEPITDLAVRSGLPFKEGVLRSLLRHWGWDEEIVAEMNNFSDWAFAKSSKLATALHRFMIEAYKRITDKKAGGADFGTHITEGDMRVLGRKVYSLYSKENGKIEFLRRVKDEATNMDSISFVATENREGTKLWSVYKGNVSSMIKKNEQIAHLLLKRSVDLVTLLLWLVRNQVYTRGSFLYLVTGKSPVSLAEIERLLKEIQAHFRPVPIWELKNEYLIKEALIEKIMVIINYELPRSISRVETLHICYANSWGEIFSFPMGAEEGYKKFVSILKNTGREFSFSDSTRFELFIPKGDARPRLKKEMNEFFVRMMPLLTEKANG